MSEHNAFGISRRSRRVDQGSKIDADGFNRRWCQLICVFLLQLIPRIKSQKLPFGTFRLITVSPGCDDGFQMRQQSSMFEDQVLFFVRNDQRRGSAVVQDVGQFINLCSGVDHHKDATRF